MRSRPIMKPWPLSTPMISYTLSPLRPQPPPSVLQCLQASDLGRLLPLRALELAQEKPTPIIKQTVNGKP